MNKYAVRIEGITDGDTVKGQLIASDLGIIFPEQKFRLMYVNTPERSQPNYKEATQFTAEHLLLGQIYNIEIYKKDAFGRWLTVIYIKEGVSINELLLKNGLAVPYI
jgi:micrococcal nuclease